MSVRRAVARQIPSAPYLIAAVAASALLLLAVPSAGAQAVSTPRTTSLSIAPYAGYLVTGHLFDGPVGTSLSSASGALYGAQASVPITSAIAVVGNVAYASGDLKVGLPLIGGLSVGSVKTLLYDAGLELRSPQALGPARAITPFLQAGIGGVRYDVAVSSLSRRATSIAYNAGVGADVSLGTNLGLRFMAKDYIGKFDVQEATGIAVNGKTAQNWALTAGLTLSF